jgi:hypothetical protein
MREDRIAASRFELDRRSVWHRLWSLEDVVVGQIDARRLPEAVAGCRVFY